MSNFHVGQRVECIWKESWGPNPLGHVMPSFGVVYVVRDAFINPYIGGPCIRLREIINPLHNYLHGPDECCFESCCFRPVIERKTSIEVFQRILLDPSQPIAPARENEPAA